MSGRDALARQRLVMDYRPRIIAPPVGDETAVRLYRAMLADPFAEMEIERADRYNIRTPAGMRAGKSRGGQFRSLSASVVAALDAWINGEGDGDPLEQFTDAQLHKAAQQLGVPAQGASRARLKLALLEKARGDVRTQRREAVEARHSMPEGYRVERLDGGRWSVRREGESGFAEADTIAEARQLAEEDRERRAARATRRRIEQSRLPGDSTRPSRPAATPMTLEGKAPRKLTDAEKVADALAAGRISERVAIELLTGRREPERHDAAAVRAFTVGMVHAGYITELAWTGDRERVETWLRRQNTSTLRMAAPFFGVSLPSDAGHERIVSLLTDRAMRLEAPRQELPSIDELRQSLMSRKVKDLQASLRAAGLPTSGRKAELVDRLVAAYGAVRGDRDDAADRADRARPAGRRDGRGRSRGAAAAQPADSEPDAPTAGPVGAGVGGGGDAGDLTGAGGLSPDPDVRAVQVENRIREAYAEAPKGARGWANIADIREHPGVRDVDRAEVDAALRRFATQSGAYLETEANQSALTDRDRAAAVRVGGENNHYLRLDDPSLRPLPTSTRPTTRPAKKATPRKATSRVTVSAGWLPGSPRPLSELSAEQAARAARENLVDPAAAAAHIRAQADEAEAAADLLRRPDTSPPDRPTGRQRPVPSGERDRHDSAARREAEAARLRRLADRIESGSPAPAPPRQAPAVPAAPAAPTPARPTMATAAKRTPALPPRPGRVSVSNSRDWTPAQHVAHAEQARQRGDMAEARLHRGLADAKNREIVESGRGLEHLRSLTDRDGARRFLRSLTRAQLDALATQLGVDVEGSRDAVMQRILALLFGGQAEG